MPSNAPPRKQLHSTSVHELAGSSIACCSGARQVHPRGRCDDHAPTRLASYGVGFHSYTEAHLPRTMSWRGISCWLCCPVGQSRHRRSASAPEPAWLGQGPRQAHRSPDHLLPSSGRRSSADRCRRYALSCCPRPWIDRHTAAKYRGRVGQHKWGAATSRHRPMR